MIESFVNVRLPKQTVEKIKKLVEEHEGLFEDESDYINHCIINYNRKVFL